MLQAELHVGISNRAVAATRMNASSSRSHAIFTIHVQQRRLVPAASAPSPAPSDDSSPALQRKDSSHSAREADQVEELVEAHMVFVDLAGLLCHCSASECLLLTVQICYKTNLPSCDNCCPRRSVIALPCWFVIFLPLPDHIRGAMQLLLVMLACHTDALKCRSGKYVTTASKE